MKPNEKVAVGLPFEFRIAGTGYERRYSAIRRHCKTRAELRLTPEHDNPHDKHAVAVQLCWTNAAGKTVLEMIGYVPAVASETVNSLLSSGEWAIEAAYVKDFDASPELDSPIVLARLEGKDLRKQAAKRA